MDEWIDLGFADFTKNDYYTVIRSFEKFDKDEVLCLILDFNELANKFTVKE